MIGLSMAMDQGARIQSMASYMNSGGASFEFMTILFILAGFLVLFIILSSVLSKQELTTKKRKPK